jgi:hypothetical protein
VEVLLFLVLETNVWEQLVEVLFLLVLGRNPWELLGELVWVSMQVLV